MFHHLAIDIGSINDGHLVTMTAGDRGAGVSPNNQWSVIDSGGPACIHSLYSVLYILT